MKRRATQCASDRATLADMGRFLRYDGATEPW